MRTLRRSVSPRLALLVACAAAASSSVAYGGGSGLVIPLRSFLDQKGLKDADIVSAQTVLTNDDAWATGTLGSVKPAYLALTRVGPAVDQGTPALLRLSYDQGGKNLRKAESCLAIGGCEELALVGAGATRRFTFGKQVWQVDAMDGACKGGDHCDAVVPSWAMDQRRRNDGGGMRPFPHVATLVQHTGGLSIFNAETAERWATWSFDGLGDDLGVMRSAFITARGVLSIQFDHAWLAADFAHDSLAVVSATGLKVASTGLGAVSDATLVALDQVKPANGTYGRPLLFADGLAVWESGWALLPVDNPNMVKGKTGFHAFTGKAVAAMPVDSRVVWMRVALIENGQIGVAAFEALRREFGETRGIAATGAAFPASTVGLRLVGDELLRVDAKGVALFAAEKFAPITMGVAGEALAVTSDGQVFITAGGGEKSCAVTLLRQDAANHSVFVNTGLAAPCGTLAYGSALGGHAAITSRTGSDLSVAILRP